MGASATSGDGVGSFPRAVSRHLVEVALRLMTQHARARRVRCPGRILLLGVMLLPRQVGAQDASVPAWLVPPHHQEEVPDYALEMATPRLRAPRLPPPPERSRHYVRHHDDRIPDYLGSASYNAARSITIPPAPRGQPPAGVRGLYLNGWVFSSDRFYDLIRLADTTEVNAFVIDVKDATGYLTYPSSVPTAVAIGANRLVRLRDPRNRLALLEAHGIHAIARIVVARDPLLAKGRPEWAIHDARGGLWQDGLGEPWVDAYNDSVWAYAAELAAEAVLVGFNEVQFDYIRFPDEPLHRLNRSVYPSRRAAESKRAAVRRNVELLRDRVSRLGVPFTLDVFGLAASTTDGDLGIGQVWEDLASAADVILPMVYPSHYRRGSFGIAHPNAAPYATVRRALQDAVARSQAMPRAARIRPYLQSFSIFRVRYTATEVRAQIQATEDLGLTDWILWNSSGRYPAAALRSSTTHQSTSPPGGGSDAVGGGAAAAPAAGTTPAHARRPPGAR